MEPSKHENKKCRAFRKCEYCGAMIELVSDIRMAVRPWDDLVKEA